MKFSIFYPTTGASKTRLRKKSAKCELYYVKRNPEEWTTKIEILKGDLQKLDVHIDDSEKMTEKLLNLPENTKPLLISY